MQNQKDYIKTFMFSMNEKAKQASADKWKIMLTIRDTTNIEKEKDKQLSLLHGQYMAYSSVYTMLKQDLDRLNSEAE